MDRLKGEHGVLACLEFFWVLAKPCVKGDPPGPSYMGTVGPPDWTAAKSRDTQRLAARPLWPRGAACTPTPWHASRSAEDPCSPGPLPAVPVAPPVSCAPSGWFSWLLPQLWKRRPQPAVSKLEQDRLPRPPPHRGRVSHPGPGTGAGRTEPSWERLWGAQSPGVDPQPFVFHRPLGNLGEACGPHLRIIFKNALGL